MNWLTRYRLENYLRRSAWVAPTLAIPLELAVFPLLRWVDEQNRWPLLGFTPDGARALLSAIAPATLTLIVFILSMMLLAVQLASSQFSPRLIAGLLANRPVRLCLSMFVVTYLLCVGTLGRIDARVPQLLLLLSIAMTVLSVAAAFYLIDYMAKELRPVQMLARTAGTGRRIIEQVYPNRVAAGDADPAARDAADSPSRVSPLPAPHDTVLHARRSAVLLAVDVTGLIEMARAADCTIEVIPRVGDFVARDDPVFRVHPAGAPLPPGRLGRSYAIGNERTPEQDPVFVFRILVDVACKALSPAINDPTTAVLALDQIHHLLRQVAKRSLDTGVVRDPPGAAVPSRRPRLVYHTPDWEDFVLVAVTEIRLYGAGTMQVARRLGAMLDNLAASVTPDRRPVLQDQLRLLHRAIDRAFADPEDRTRAHTGDSQGVGGVEDHRAAAEDDLRASPAGPAAG